jgi:CheY-like chemotaxis protein/two-component sensor histidine kinase
MDKLAVIKNDNKSEFLARMSHEIRTPMNAIIGTVELALQEEISENTRESLHMIRQSGNNLQAIINDILDYSKIEQGKLDVVEYPYNFASLLHDVISIIQMKYIESKLRFAVNLESNIPASLLGDEIRIRQIILNILENAFKYTHQGFVSLVVTKEEVDEDGILLKIKIQDSGIGIKEESQLKLFDDFAKIEAMAGYGAGGTGLGLSIGKRLANLMGGDVTLESKYGEGTLFTVTIPQKVDSWEKIAKVDEPDKYRILVYERRDIYLQSLSTTLDDLEVSYKVVRNDSEFYDNVSTGDYNYIMIPRDFLVNITPIMKKLRMSVKIILLTKLGEGISEPSKISITMPVYSVSIANALNGKGIGRSGHYVNHSYSVDFTAPKAQVLIVDDIFTNLKVAEGLLLPFKMKIDLCQNGEEAIKMVRRHHYDIVFMDHMMPVKDGMEATKEIRELEGERFKTMNIIALTANAVSGMREQFLENGFDDFVSKPIEIAKLYGVVDKWIPEDKKIKQHGIVEEKDLEPIIDLKIKNVDVIKGITMTGGSTEDYLRTLSTFYNDGLVKVEELEKLVKGVEESLPIKELKEYERGIHALKSILGTIGAQNLSELAHRLEDAVSKEDVEFIKVNNDIFLTQLKELLENIEKVLPKRGEIAVPQGIEEYRQPLLSLRNAIKELNFDVMDEITGSLEYQDYSAEVGGVIENILEATLIGDYWEAMELIESVLQ